MSEAPIDAIGGSSIETDVRDGTTWIALSGEIDAGATAVLHESAVTAERNGFPVMVDASALTFMDSSGLAFLARLCARLPGLVSIRGLRPSVRFLLEVTQLDERITILDS